MNLLKALGPFAVFFLLLLLLGCGKEEKENQITPGPDIPVIDTPNVLLYLTSPDKSLLLQKVENAIFPLDQGITTTIQVNMGNTFQEIDGFGFALTGGSSQHISAMGDQAKNQLLEELFGKQGGQIGISLLRISLGGSDLDSEAYSYNDLPAGSTDIGQEQFSILREQATLIPLLKQIQQINPDLRIMASPWSAPAWMKDNGSTVGGSLKREYFDSYALYLLKYFLDMEASGITIDYLTIQNEPLHAGNNPSMYMTAEDQRDFIKNSLGPLFAANEISTKLVVYDHNADRTDYPILILNDSLARQYVDGSAFHLYAGNIAALSTVKVLHPDKSIYFTEQWYGANGNFQEDLKWHIREVVIGSIRNWSKSVIEWNLSSNPSLEPHTPGGCSECLGAITIAGDQVERNAGYYVIGHVSKWVEPGSVRLFSTYTNDLPNVAFLTPSQKVVLLVLNNSDAKRSFNVSQDSIQFSHTLDPGDVSTYIWNSQ